MTKTVPWGTLATYVREKPRRFFVYLHLHSAGQPFIQVSSLYETGGFTNLTQKVIIQLHQQYILVTVPEPGHMNTVRLPPQNPSILQRHLITSPKSRYSGRSSVFTVWKGGFSSYVAGGLPSKWTAKSILCHEVCDSQG